MEAILATNIACGAGFAAARGEWCVACAGGQVYVGGAAAGAGWGQQTAGGGGEVEVADEGRRVIEADKRIRGQS